MQKFNITPFTNFPINFKELNHSDFDGYIFEDNSKTIIDEKGYISDKLNEIIDLDKKDTTVINASVGQGKTTAIIKFIERYFKANNNGENYIVVIAAPFKSLVKQYKDKIIEESGLSDIYFDYQDLEVPGTNKSMYASFHKKPIQLVSINSLLGNSGDIAPKQADVKREYYESLIEFAEKNNKKVILIFDEIHEAIHNFKENLVFNLFKWHPVTHKIFVSSATFNEASKVVVKYLAELTDKRIKIIESVREQDENKLSDLHICLYDQYHYNADSEVLERLLIDETSDFDKIHILTYSQSLAKNIHQSDLGRKLKERFGELNLCTSKSNLPFDKDLNNIGTVFKTGISIEDDNCAFFIIMPPKSAYIDNKGKLGIFSEGIFNVVQALARPRKKASIYIIMPSPERLIMMSKTDNYIKSTSLDYLPFDNPSYHSTFHNINSQDNLLKDFYNKQRNNLKKGEDFVENNNLRVMPNFPAYDKYKLSEGEKVYRYYYDIFGKNLSNYIYWAAWNNQFVNCKLKTISKVSLLKFSYDNVQHMLDNYYVRVFSGNSFFVLNSDKDCYIKFRSSLYSNNIVYKQKGEKEYQSVSSYRNSYFEQQVIAFIQRRKREFNFDFRKMIYPPDGDMAIYKNGSFIGWKKPLDIDGMQKETYIRLAMLYSIQLENIPKVLTAEETTLINAYKTLYSYKEILLSQYSIKSKKGDSYLPIDSKINFKPEHQIELTSVIDHLRKYDVNLKAFSFLQKSKNLVPVYKLLKDLFFESKTTTITSEEGGKKIKVNVIEPIIFPKKEDYINLIYSIDDAWILQSGNGQVKEEYSSNPFYGHFD